MQFICSTEFNIKSNMSFHLYSHWNCLHLTATSQNSTSEPELINQTRNDSHLPSVNLSQLMGSRRPGPNDSHFEHNNTWSAHSSWLLWMMEYHLTRVDIFLERAFNHIPIPFLFCQIHKLENLRVELTHVTRKWPRIVFRYTNTNRSKHS